MNPRWLLNASRWARNPPSARRVWLVLGVVTVCLALAGLERWTRFSVGEAPKTVRPFTSF